MQYIIKIHACIYSHPNPTHALLCKKPSCNCIRVAEVRSLADLQGLRSQAPSLNRCHKIYFLISMLHDVSCCFFRVWKWLSQFSVQCYSYCFDISINLCPKLSLLSSYHSISWNDAQASPQQKHPEDTLPATDSQIESVHRSPKSGDGSRAPVSPTSSLPSSASKASGEVTLRELYNRFFSVSQEIPGE